MPRRNHLAVAECLGQGRLEDLPLVRLERNPFQPRRSAVRYQKIKELAGSIRAGGLIQPIFVIEKDGDNGEQRFFVAAGERRWRACAFLKKERIPAFIRPLTNAEQFEQVMRWLALTENLQRKAFNSLEEARAFKAYADEGFDQREIADIFHVSQTHVSVRLGLLDLDPFVRRAVRDGAVDPYAAVTVTRSFEVPPGVQREMVGRVVKRGATTTLSAREQRQMMLEVAAEAGLTRRWDGQPADLALLEDKMRNLFQWVERSWEDLLTIGSKDLSTLVNQLAGLSVEDRLLLQQRIELSVRGLKRIEAALAKIAQEEERAHA